MRVKNKKTGREYSILNKDWENMQKNQTNRLFSIIDYDDKIDTLDIGCGIGGSLGWSKRVFGWSSFMGIDSSESDIKQAINYGYKKECFIVDDIIKFDFSIFPKFRYSTILHVLEHIESEQDIENIINKAISVSDEFVFIKHPFFDGDEYLKEHNLKFTWSDWVGHPTHIGKDMLTKILNKTGLQYVIGFVNEIKDSSFDLIIPYSAPIDTLKYDKVKHGKKKFVEFDGNIFHETYAFINTGCKNWEKLIKTKVL